MWVGASAARWHVYLPLVLVLLTLKPPSKRPIRSIPTSWKLWSNSLSQVAHGRTQTRLHFTGSWAERIWAAGSFPCKRTMCPNSCSWRSMILLLIQYDSSDLLLDPSHWTQHQWYPKILLKYFVPKTMSRFFLQLTGQRQQHSINSLCNSVNTQVPLSFESTDDLYW